MLQYARVQPDAMAHVARGGDAQHVTDHVLIDRFSRLAAADCTPQHACRSHQPQALPSLPFLRQPGIPRHTVHLNVCVQAAAACGACAGE